MQVQRDDAAQTERIVMDRLQTHGPTTMEKLVRALVGLSWAQVFSAIDRLSRENKVRLRQTPEHDYVIDIPAICIAPPVLAHVLSTKKRLTIGG
jgi:hypothetical protein